jgi:hypothetical protein
MNVVSPGKRSLHKLSWLDGAGALPHEIRSNASGLNRSD